MPLFQINQTLAKQRYSELAAQYDYATRRIEPVRKQVIDSLQLKPGQRVLDVACGTGKSFQMLRDAVGPEGTVIGVEQSPDMLRQAAERVEEAGWDNVKLIESAMETADMEGPFDAVLFVYTQDVLQSDNALTRIFEATRPGAMIASTGLKLFPWYLSPANIWLMAISYPYFTTFKGLTKPWQPLEEYVEINEIKPTFGGSGYTLVGKRR